MLLVESGRKLSIVGLGRLNHIVETAINLNKFGGNVVSRFFTKGEAGTVDLVPFTYFCWVTLTSIWAVDPRPLKFPAMGSP